MEIAVFASNTPSAEIHTPGNRVFRIPNIPTPRRKARQRTSGSTPEDLGKHARRQRPEDQPQQVRTAPLAIGYFLSSVFCPLACSMSSGMLLEVFWRAFRC